MKHAQIKEDIFMGRGGGLVARVLAFYSDDPSSNPGEVFFCKMSFEKSENKWAVQFLSQIVLLKYIGPYSH